MHFLSGHCFCWSLGLVYCICNWQILKEATSSVAPVDGFIVLVIFTVGHNLVYSKFAAKNRLVEARFITFSFCKQ